MKDFLVGSSSAAADGHSLVDPLAAVMLALTAQPIDEPLLFNHVWEYAIGERSRGTPPGRVIMTLTDLVVDNEATALRNQALQRAVIVAAVEAYFGQIGGEVLGPAYPEYSGASQARALLVPSERGMPA